MARKPLTIRTVQTLKPRATVYEHMDPSCPGLGVRVTPNGAKSWIYRYRTTAGRLRRVTIGKVAELGLKTARDAWREARAVRNAGGDPLEERRQQVATARAEEAARKRGSLSVAEVLTAWRHAHRDDWRRATREEYARQCAKCIEPVIGEMAFTDVAAADVLRVLGQFTDKVRMRNYVRGTMRTAWNWAAGEHGIAALRGAPNVPAAVEVARVRTAKARGRSTGKQAFQPEDAQRLFGRLRSEGTLYADLLALQLLTGVRAGEAGGALSSERRGDVWTVAGGRTKSGTRHRVVLSEAAQAIWKRRAGRGAAPLFPGVRVDVATRHIKRHAEGLGLDPHDFATHSLRKSIAHAGLKLFGAPPPVIDWVLHHAPNDALVAAYMQADWSAEAAELWRRWGEYLEGKRARVVRLAGGAA